MVKIRRLGISLEELENIVKIINNTIYQRWNTSVPITPGKKYEVQD